MEPTGAGGRRSTVRITAASAALIVVALLAALVLRNVFAASHRVLGWAAASMVVAIMLMPPVRWLSRFVPRVVALLVAGVVIAAVAVVLVSGVFEDLQVETELLQRRGPAAAARLERRDDRVGELARDLNLVARAEDAFAGLKERFGIGPEVIASAVGTVPSYVVSFVLTIFFVLYGPTIVAGGIAQIDEAERRRRVATILELGVQRGRSYLWWALLQGAFVGSLVFAFVELFDLPAPTVLALVAAVVAMVPYIGIVIGLIPTLLMVAGYESATVAAALVGVGLAAQAVEALVVRRAVDRRTLHVGPAIPVIIGSLGLEVYGVGGALYGAALAVLVLALADAAATGVEEPLPTPNRDWVGGQEGVGDEEGVGDREAAGPPAPSGTTS